MVSAFIPPEQVSFVATPTPLAGTRQNSTSSSKIMSLVAWQTRSTPRRFISTESKFFFFPMARHYARRDLEVGRYLPPIHSFPTHALRTSGTTTEPSACW